MATRMQQRRGTAAEWAAANPVLALGELGLETDTGAMKFGDGTSTWNQRPIAFSGVFLTPTGKAYDSERLDGLDSTAFMKTGDVPTHRREDAKLVSSNYVVVEADEAKLIQADSASAISVTIPDHAASPIPVGTWVDIIQWGAGKLTVAPASGVTFVNKGRSVLNQSFAAPSRYSVVRALKVANNTWLIMQLTESDTGWLDLSAIANWNSTHFQNWAPEAGNNSAYRVIDNRLYLKLFAQYVNATAQTVSADGNISDTQILKPGTLPIPASSVHIFMPRNGVHSAFAKYYVDGAVNLVSATAGGVVSNGGQFHGTLAGWPLD